MKVQKFIFCIYATFLVSNANAQFHEEQIPTISVGFGYFGELLTHPGITVFGEYAINKSRNQLLTRLNLVYYHHEDHLRSWMIIPELVFRRNTRNMNFVESSIGPGYLYQRADSKTMEYDGRDFSETHRGWHYFAPSLAIRGGKSFFLNNDHLLALSAGIRACYQYPFNDACLLRAAADFSISYKIK